MYGGFYFKSLRKGRNNSSAQQYNTHSTSVPRSTTNITCRGKYNTDKLQHSPRNRKEGGYKVPANSTSGGNKREEKVVDCKELQVFVTDYN